jgi:hypothetical protein
MAEEWIWMLDIGYWVLDTVKLETHIGIQGEKLSLGSKASNGHQ